MTASTQIRLVVMTSSPNDAERIASHLRNAGHVVHAEWISDLDKLDTQLPLTDLVLCASENLPKAKLKDVVERCLRAPRQISVLAMNDTVEIGRTTQGMRAGARDLVSLQHMEHLQAVVLRELEHTQLRRNLQEVNSRLLQAETRHESLLQDSAEALAYIQEGIHIRVNPAYAKLFGFSDIKSVEGLPLMDLIALEDRPALKQHLRLVARGQPDKAAQTFRGLSIDGSLFPIGIRFTPTQIDDEDCIEVMIVADHVAAPKIEARIEVPSAAPPAIAPVEKKPAAPKAAPAAPVVAPTPVSPAAVVTPAPAPPAPIAAPAPGFTGGQGRQALYAALDEALKNAEQQPGLPALLFVRVDNLDRLELRLGFDQADQVFNELATFMLQSSGAGDRSFRFSSSEFAVLANRPDLQQLEHAARELRSTVAGQVFGDKQATSLTISVAALPLVWHNETQQILRDARQQVTAVQSREGSGVYVESPRTQAGTPQQEEKQWIAKIKTALELNRFRLVYKSIVNLEGETSHFFDALVRMLDEKGDEVPALNFIPIAERYNLMLAIDQWVVQHALLTMGAQQKTDHEYGLFVRVSESAITGADKFMPWLLKQIKGYPIKPEGLFLTYSETSLLDNLPKAKQLFTDLRKLKIRTAISHFGVSPQALTLLEELPVDFVRLDAAVIKALVNPKAGERVSETLKQARQKGVRIVAKQVTDAQTMAMLWTLGVHFIEGEYTQEPENFMKNTA